MIAIREGGRADIKTLYALYDSIGKKDAGYFEHVLSQQCDVFIAALDGQDCAFCILNHAPRYSAYRKLGIPEIQDLNVIASHRRMGVARALIKWCEGIARAKGRDTIGISVGLFKDYGPAQILYANMGYVPDGNGVTYDREGVTPYQPYLLDDNLSLMMVKSL